VFAVIGDQVVTAVDHKPKKSRHLRRLTNIAIEPRVTVLVDHYDEDWGELWWVRADGRATVVAAEAAGAQLDALQAKYPEYRKRRPSGQVILIDVQRWRSWQAKNPGPE
jgi:PPOX class probable F420-dependent enzyme